MVVALKGIPGCEGQPAPRWQARPQGAPDSRLGETGQRLQAGRVRCSPRSPGELSGGWPSSCAPSAAGPAFVPQQR